MNILIWNCQGIVNRKTRHALKLLIQKHQVHAVFLSETHCTKEQHKSLPRSVGLQNIIHFDRVDRASGLAFLYDDSISVNVRDVNYFYIDVDVKDSSEVQWRFTGFYGHPETEQRHISWDLLRSLAGNASIKWVVAGDFNEILDLGEKSGGRLRSLNQMNAFRQALLDCNMEDMGAAGGSFTWSDSNTKERLDRGVCSPGWWAEFGFSRIINLPLSRSDHVPLLLEVHKEHVVNYRGRRRFRFEEMWCSHESFSQVVDAAWAGQQDFPKGIEDVVVNYFQQIFASQESNLEAQDVVLQSIDVRVTTEMNDSLLAPYTVEEIKEALFQMHPYKAPRPDGMSPFFFQKYWDLVGSEVCHAVISLLTTKDMPQGLNFTHVVLIPKVKEVQTMSQLQPIALCNVVYKIASKVLANRLKAFLPRIISQQQSAFVPDRLISDNTLVASELAHYMHRLCRGQEGFLALKLDISKAYDRLEWSFL
ncbi:uncharacterized protein LOC112199223 [Rosa chinensis]|uniref:uncharacterized protein LOC112199223 n=1 Tax=Rosa chinensis TaxID=74649 RepID=UPI000D086D66|nr:uncharacterized protein LOC112199223 [Rosa chinensis]